MIKVKRKFIADVICLGQKDTRNYTYYCDGRIDYSPAADMRDPLAYIVYRLPVPGKNDFDTVARPPFEIVGLFKMDGTRL